MRIRVAIAAGLVGLSTFAGAGPGRAQVLREVTIAAGSSTLVGSGMRMAKELGLFEKRGLTAKITSLDTASAAATALISGSVEFATAGPAEVIVAQTRGQKVVALASAYQGLGASLVVAKALADRSGLSATSPVTERLRVMNDAVIGAPSPTATYKMAFEGAARSVGASPRFTYMSQTAMPAALESGAIQGYVASAPVWASSLLRGTGVLWITGPKGEVPPEFSPANSILLLTMRRFAEAEPKLMDGMRGVVADLASAVRERPSDVKAAMRRLFPDLDEKSVELLFSSESPAWMTRPLRVEDIKREIDFLKASGVQLTNVDALEPASILSP